MTKLILIAAVGEDGAIGRDNSLLFSDAEDRRHLRDATMGHPVIMGRRTWDSLPERFRPLPGRRNIVLTRDRAWSAVGAETVPDLDAAIALVADAPQAFVFGGADIYALALPRADDLMLTEIGRRFADADRWFPEWNRDDFEVAASRTATAADGTPLRFATYRRKR